MQPQNKPLCKENFDFSWKWNIKTNHHSKKINEHDLQNEKFFPLPTTKIRGRDKMETMASISTSIDENEDKRKILTLVQTRKENRE